MIVRRLSSQFLLLLIIIAGVCLPAWAVVETFDFNDQGDQHQYQYLTETLRCPKCQNQNIADSNAPIAQDMRKEVHRLVTEGKTDDEVIGFMVDRFGEFVVYKPKLDGSTLILWFGPLVVGLVGMMVVVMIIRKNRRVSAEKKNSTTELNTQEKEALKKLLDE